MRVIDEQEKRYAEFLAGAAGASAREGSLAVVEFGAGTFVVTIRRTSESLMATHAASLVRVNLREAEVPEAERAVGLPMGALQAIRSLDAALRLPASNDAAAES
jgi:hypothetical protein